MCNLKELLRIATEANEKNRRFQRKSFDRATKQLITLIGENMMSQEFKKRVLLILELLSKEVRNYLVTDNTVLIAALKKQETAHYAEILLECGVNSECTPSPFLLGIYYNQIEFCSNRLDERGAILFNEFGERRLPPLALAIKHGYYDLALCLITKYKHPKVVEPYNPLNYISFTIREAPRELKEVFGILLAKHGYTLNHLAGPCMLTNYQYALIFGLERLAKVIKEHPEYNLQAYKAKLPDGREMNDKEFEQSYRENPEKLRTIYFSKNQ
jgi:hypothetical protein